MDDKHNPWMKFYVTDWQGDQMLRLCSLAARGLWTELLCIMHKATPYGHLLINNISLSETQIAAFTGSSADEIRSLLAELETAGVFSRTADGVIYSRRMVRDEKKRVDGKKAAESGTLPQSRRGRKVPENKGENLPPPRVVEGVENKPPPGVDDRVVCEPPPHPEARVQSPDIEKERTDVLSQKNALPQDEPIFPMEATSPEDHPTHDPPVELIDPTALKPLDEASQAVNAWNELAVECGLAQVQKLTPDRRKKLRKRLKDCDGIEGWMYALGKIRSTPGLQGKAGKPWKANFDFLIQESKFVKLMEGGYDGWTTNGYGTENGFNAAPERRSNRDVFMSAFHKVACRGRLSS